MISLVRKNKELLRVILALCILAAGIAHFVVPEPFVKIVPDFLPYPLSLVYLSGVFEILGAVGLLTPPVSRAAAWGLVALLIAVYPSNINMAVNHIHLNGIPTSFWFQAIRLPFQFVLVAWAYWYTKPDIDGNQASIPGYPQ